MSLIQIHDLEFSYERNQPTLSGINFDVEKGSVLGLLGRNGAGKTTILNLLLGLMRPAAGSVRVFGMDPVIDGVAVKQRIGYVSEDQILPEYLTLTRALEMHKAIFPDWDDAFVAELRARFQIPDNKLIGKMSKGQARQVALLCAVAHKPELLILDEPGSSVDPVVRRELLETSIDLLTEAGSTIIFSSHNIADVERLANRIIMLDAGQVVIDAELDAIKEGYCIVSTTAESESIDILRGMPDCRRTRSNRGAVRAVFACAAATLQPRLDEKLPGAEAHGAALEDLFIELLGESGA